MSQEVPKRILREATPEGRMSEYLSGIDYLPRDVR